jgi:hypothetical protein
MDNNEYLFTIIGKLYADINNAQRIIEVLQNKVKEKDQEIINLKKDN